MNMRTYALPGLALFASAAFAQSSAPPAFDVASVKVLTGAQGRGGGEGHMGGGRGGFVQTSPGSLNMRNTTLKNAIRWAYGVTEYQVSGPEWLDSTRYDIAAKAAGPAKDAELQRMTQTLLADRFKLAFHRDTKEFHVYVLAVGKNGAKLQESTSEGESAIQPEMNRMAVTVHRTPVSMMIDMLNTVVGAPVIDETGLKGRYDVSVNLGKYAAEMQSGAGSGAPPDLITLITAALEGELGLKLEARKMALEVLIVDHAEKTPTEN